MYDLDFTLCIAQFSSINADSVNCEKTDNYDWSGIRTLKTCYIQTTTRIDSRDVTIASSDVNIKGLALWYNKGIKFLPIRLKEAFPNLMGLSAYGCSLTEISYENFAGLSKLEYLNLGANLIEKINDDTFKDLTSLKRLDSGMPQINLKYLD